MRIAVLTATVLSLTGCFVYDSPYDRTPSATLQIVVTSNNYGGTYAWSPRDNAYEAMVGNTLYYVYMDSNGYWCLGAVLSQINTGGSVMARAPSTYANCGRPPTVAAGWTGSSVVSSVDDSEGGIHAGASPDSSVVNGSVLQAAFLASSPGNSATYRWVSSPNQNGSPSNLPSGPASGSTYTILSGDYAKWIRVIITPADSTGTIQGTPVTSQPVRVP